MQSCGITEKRIAKTEKEDDDKEKKILAVQ
jgi:hypothetical protein